MAEIVNGQPSAADIESHIDTDEILTALNTAYGESDAVATALNTTHRGSSGSDHSKVGANETAAGLNTTHRGSNGSDHSKVGANETAIGLNTTHRGSDGSDHSKIGTNTSNIATSWSGIATSASNISTNVTAIGLNTTHRGSDGSDHSKVGANESAIAAISVEASLSFVIDGGGNAITTGIKGDLEVPFDCEIKAVTLLADQTGSITIDIWKDTYGNFPPDNNDTITGANEPAISGGVKDQDATLTSWTKSLTKGDILRFYVDSVATIQRVTLSLKVDKS